MKKSPIEKYFAYADYSWAFVKDGITFIVAAAIVIPAMIFAFPFAVAGFIMKKIERSL